MLYSRLLQHDEKAKRHNTWFNFYLRESTAEIKNAVDFYFICTHF